MSNQRSTQDASPVEVLRIVALHNSVAYAAYWRYATGQIPLDVALAFCVAVLAAQNKELFDALQAAKEQ